MCQTDTWIDFSRRKKGPIRKKNLFNVQVYDFFTIIYDQYTSNIDRIKYNVISSYVIFTDIDWNRMNRNRACNSTDCLTSLNSFPPTNRSFAWYFLYNLYNMAYTSIHIGATATFPFILFLTFHVSIYRHRASPNSLTA